jgi:hypothetical protein
MVRHDHVTPKRDIKLVTPATSVSLQSKLTIIQGRNGSAITRRKGYEVEWLVDVDQIESSRAILNHSLGL